MKRSSSFKKVRFAPWGIGLLAAIAVAVPAALGRITQANPSVRTRPLSAPTPPKPVGVPDLPLAIGCTKPAVPDVAPKAFEPEPHSGADRLQQLLETLITQDHGVALSEIRSTPTLLEQFRQRIQSEDPKATAFLVRAAADLALQKAREQRFSIPPLALREWLWTAPAILERFELLGKEGTLADLWSERFGGDPNTIYRILTEQIGGERVRAAYENLPPSMRTEVDMRLVRDYRQWKDGGLELKPSQWNMLLDVANRYGLSVELPYNRSLLTPPNS